MLRMFALCGLLISILPSAALAEANADRFQINNDIHIQADDQVGDVTCLNCSVYVLGQVSGDVTTINGNIVVEQSATISGDVTTVRGNARLENGTQVAGDLTAIAGTVRRDPQASVGGDVTSMGGGGWVFLVFLLPFAILGGIVALIIWLIQRSRRPAPVPAYTLHRN
jgi:lipopolysaccharide export system protein LptA